MNRSLVDFLVCPQTKSKLNLVGQILENGKVKSGTLVSECGKHKYEIIKFVPRFVNLDNYANSFGWQWNKFGKTQMDSFSGHPITYNRFWNATGWNKHFSDEEWILDAGCGSGRFAEISSQAGGNLVTIDYSNAVDACYENLGHLPNINIIQADIYNLPFEDDFFSHIYSLGVLQHTPDVKKAVYSLSQKLRPGGLFCIDFYEKSIKSMLLPKYWLRPFTTKIKKEKVFSFLEAKADSLLTISGVMKKIPVFGKLLARLVPIADYTDILPLNKQQTREWAILDTFDWLTPTYDNPQTRKTIRKWLVEFDFENIEVLKEGHIVGRGTKI